MLNTARTFHRAAAITLMIGAACFAGSDTAGPGSGKNMPHPPTTQPPAFMPNMVVRKAPPATEPIQRPDDYMPIKAGIKRPDPKPIQTAAAPIHQPAFFPAATSRSAPVIAEQVVKQPESVNPALTTEPGQTAPAKLSGYVVFVAGLLLLFRRVD